MPDNETDVQQLAAGLRRRNLRLPALIVLDIGPPLAFVFGQLLWLAQPALSLVVPRDAVGRLARLFEEPEAVSALISHLEAE